MKLSFDIAPILNYFNIRQFLPGEKHIARIFNEHVLLLVYKGVLRFVDGDAEVEVYPGQYYIQRANNYQGGHIESDSPNYYYFHFSGEINENGLLPLRGTFDLAEMEVILHQLLMLPLNASLVERQSYFYAILTELLYQNTTTTVEGTIKNFIQQHYKENITINDFEKLVFLSKNQIINIFKATYNETPYQYIQKLRLNEACELLLSTERSLDIIATSVGFNDYSCFYKAFYKRFKMSPSDYRKIRPDRKDDIIGTNPPSE